LIFPADLLAVAGDCRLIVDGRTWRVFPNMAGKVPDLRVMPDIG